jgi:hypothetical protein
MVYHLTECLVKFQKKRETIMQYGFKNYHFNSQRVTMFHELWVYHATIILLKSFSFPYFCLFLSPLLLFTYLLITKAVQPDSPLRIEVNGMNAS